MTRGGGRFAFYSGDSFGGCFTLYGGVLCFGGWGGTAALCDSEPDMRLDCFVASFLAKNCVHVQIFCT
jgi:hypothetical protein